MRDNNGSMLEIIDAFIEDDHYFGVIAITLDGVRKKFRFGVSRKGYVALKQILQLRPFDMMPGLKRCYFYDGHTFRVLDYKTSEIGDCEIRIRVEQGKVCKTILVESSKEFMQNLIWFNEIKDFSETTHLQEVQ